MIKQFVISAALMVTSFSSMALPVYTEPNGYDAGNYSYYTSSDTTTMFGKIGGSDTSDTFAFQWDGGQLVVNTFGITNFDSILWLYNNSGLIYNMNDNAYSGTIYSQMINHLPAGIYHIKITSQDMLPLGSSYQINRNVSSHGIVSGITPVYAPPVPPTVITVPEPSIIFLIITGFIILLFTRKTKQ